MKFKSLLPTQEYYKKYCNQSIKNKKQNHSLKKSTRKWLSILHKLDLSENILYAQRE